ncbi:MAG: type I restriction-modification system subunit M [Spirochaetaceae bacterium]|mgnify:FL=1|nr:type I restriction-modification system subunit M [Spirochaetaceae bacterium]|tara:strand:+ start:2502 stop:3992 length:1491 start_codon:yes stop_codon:yes gene_type:complete
MTKISQDEINGILWKACDTFRGVVDPSEYKNYILVMLFVKYLSDVWKDHYQQFEKQYAGDKERIQRRLAKERFVLPDGCDFDSLYDQRNEANIGEIINVSLEKIEEANKTKLEGVFRNIDFNSESNLGKTKDRNARLKNLLTDFHDPRLDLRPSRIGNLDIIGNAYEYLIARFAANAGKKGGEFYTPAEVAELLARLVEPKSGDTICDPTCGSGSLLIKAANLVEDGNRALYGQESNGSTWALGMMNMFLHGMDSARMEWGDTLNNPQLLEKDKLMKFNVVVANPPFSLDKWGADTAEADTFNRFWRGVPPKSKGDYAFITHMVETAHETDGRVAVIAPHGVLFRGSSEGKIRQAFIEENLLDTVIGLPPNLFYGTGIPACILVFKKGRKKKDVLFIDASREFEQGKNQNRLREKDLKKILDTYTKRKSVDKYAYVASISEIEENEYNLNIPRYVDTFEEEEEIDIKAVQKEIESIDKELATVEQEMSGYLKELNL